MKMLLKQTISCMAVIILITGIGIADAPDGKIITPPSRVDRVMVYHDRALVTRVIRCGEIKPGVYDLIVPNMPGILLDESVHALIQENSRHVRDNQIVDARLYFTTTNHARHKRPIVIDHNAIHA